MKPIWCSGSHDRMVCYGHYLLASGLYTEREIETIYYFDLLYKAAISIDPYIGLVYYTK